MVAGSNCFEIAGINFRIYVNLNAQRTCKNKDRFFQRYDGDLGHGLRKPIAIGASVAVGVLDVNSEGGQPFEASRSVRLRAP